MTETTISMRQAKKILANTWIYVFLFLLIVLLIQTFFGRYGSKYLEAWGWFTTALVPTCTLIVSVLVYDENNNTDNDALFVTRHTFKLTMIFSIVYLLVAISIVLLMPFTGYPPLELMHRSQLPMGIVHGLSTAMLGVFFSSAEEA